MLEACIFSIDRCTKNLAEIFYNDKQVTRNVSMNEKVFYSEKN